nr:hypothetical protein [Tanacetum cinerariifolium]
MSYVELISWVEKEAGNLKSPDKHVVDKCKSPIKNTMDKGKSPVKKIVDKGESLLKKTMHKGKSKVLVDDILVKKHVRRNNGAENHDSRWAFIFNLGNMMKRWTNCIFRGYPQSPTFPLNEFSSNVLNCVPSGIRPTRRLCERRKTARPLMPARLLGISPVVVGQVERFQRTHISNDIWKIPLQTYCEISQELKDLEMGISLQKRDECVHEICLI